MFRTKYMVYLEKHIRSVINSYFIIVIVTISVFIMKKWYVLVLTVFYVLKILNIRNWGNRKTIKK